MPQMMFEHVCLGAQHASEIRLRPSGFTSLLSSIGGFAKFVQVALGIGAIWWTKRKWNSKPRDMWLMGQDCAHRVQFPKIQLDAEQLDEALAKGAVDDDDLMKQDQDDQQAKNPHSPA